MTSSKWQTLGWINEPKDSELAMNKFSYKAQDKICRVDLSWWNERKVTVWGAAISGISAANLLVELGAQVTLSDPKDVHELPLINILSPKVKTILGQKNQLAEAEVLIPSPGLKPSHPLLQEAFSQGIQVMSEIELGAHVTQAKIIAITGTDGKSTTTSLIEAGLEANGCWAKAVGNIGEPLCNWVLKAPKEGFLVLEVSAFQLWSTHFLDAEVAIITNIAEDHHDYFDGDALAYRQSKLRLGHLLKKGALLLYPQDRLDPHELHLQVGQRLLDIQLSTYQAPSEPITSPLLGLHNQFNLAAALEVISYFDIDLKVAQNCFKTFSPLPYRMTLSGVCNGVTYVNDSKATNVHAAQTGIESITGSLIVITGGYDKGLDLSPWISCLQAKSRLVLCIGQTGLQIDEKLSQLGLNSLYVETIEQAVNIAHQKAKEEELVIFSPAASSYDQFKNFEERGATFDTLVALLP